MGTERTEWLCDRWHDPLLIVRLSSLGDVILATALVELLRGRRPDLAVDFLTRRCYAPLVRLVPGVRQVIEAEGCAQGCERDGAQPRLPVYRQVLDLQGGAKGRRALRRWAPGARRLTYDRASWKRRLIVLAGERVGPAVPLVLRFAEALAGRGRTPAADGLRPTLVAPGERLDWVAGQLRGVRRAGRRLVLMSPGASRPLKCIPPALVVRLRHAFDARGWDIIELRPPAVAGTSRGAGVGGEPPAEWGRFGQTRDGGFIFQGPLLTVTALLAQVDAAVCSDSGILHLAGAVGTPVVGLFGPTSPALGFSPLGHGQALGVELACRPCHLHGPSRCWLRHMRCWKEMPVSRITSAVAALLARCPAADPPSPRG
jgi:heptosyltransferase II